MDSGGWLWGSTEVALNGALDASELRQRVIAHNLANAETPGYRRFDVVFESELARRAAQAQQRKLPLARTHPAHLPGPVQASVRPAVVRDETTLMRNDRSNVDLERELAGMAKNGLFYQAVSQILSTRLGGLRNAIHEGRR